MKDLKERASNGRGDPAGLLVPAQVQMQAQQAFPPAAAGTVLVAGIDPRTGLPYILNLQLLAELATLAERHYAEDRIDDRQRVQATIASGSAVGASASAQITVPSGEVWYLNRLELVSPAGSGPGVGDIVQVNVRVSRWPDPAGDPNGRAYFSSNQGTAAADTFTIDLPAQGELGEELRLVGGDVLTLVAVLTGAAAGADLTASLTPYGRKGKLLNVAP